MGDTLLVDCAQAVLDTIVAAMDDPPARQFLTDGDPTDSYSFCPMVAVAMAPQGLFQSINVAARGPSLPARPTTRTSSSQLILKAWVITDVCWPTQEDDGAVPPAAEITEHAEAILTVRYQVWRALRDACRDGSLFAGILAGNDSATVDPPATAFGPQGQVAGTILSVYSDLIGLPEGS